MERATAGASDEIGGAAEAIDRIENVCHESVACIAVKSLGDAELPANGFLLDQKLVENLTNARAKGGVVGQGSVEQIFDLEAKVRQSGFKLLAAELAGRTIDIRRENVK